MSNFSDLEDRVQSLEDNLSENSENLDSLQNDIEQSISSIQEQQQTSEESLGQLSFPLTQETIDLITEQSPAIMMYLFNQNYIGTTTLSAGTSTVINPLITTSSLVILSRSTTGGTLGHLSYTVSVGSLVITSSSNTETSTIIYFILTT